MCAIDLASVSASLRLDVSNFVTNAQRAADAAQGIQKSTEKLMGGGFTNWVNQHEQAIGRWGKGLTAFGGIVLGSMAAPVIAGSRAVWSQIDAVEQATFALRAYEQDASKVEDVLSGLIAYARSDMGVLFQREDLFGAAQGLKIMGAETENLVEYVEIMSRSVGVTGASWEDLTRIIGRVGATGRMTGDDFEMLTKMGYQLDDSLRNTNMTWEELFTHLDAGIPAEALAGQADTIRGKSIQLQSSIRDLGAAFLGVDTDTSKFIEGGLGWQMVRGMERLRSLFIAARPAVNQFGNIVAAAARPLGTMFDWLVRLPQPVQTGMLMFTAATGALSLFSGGLLLMLPRIASTVTAFQSLGGLSGVLGGVATAIRGIGTASLALFANPLILTGALALGAVFAAYKTNFLGFGDSVDHALGKLGSFTDALNILLGKPSTKNFDIVTTADNVWDQWQIQEDGSYKNAELGITSKPDDGSLQYMGYDAETGKWVVLYINAEGEELPGWVESSSQDPNDPTKFFMEISLEGGETVTAVYDEVKGTYQILEDPAEFVLDADKAIEDMNLLEKAALAVRSIFVLVNARVQEFSDILSVLAHRFQPVLDFAKRAYEFFNPFGAVIDRVTGTFETLNNILLGDWGSISWEAVMDAAGLGLVYEIVSTLADGYNRLNEEWNKWTSRDKGDADTGMDPHEGQPVQFPDGENLGFGTPNFGPQGGMGGVPAGGKGAGVLSQLTALVAANRNAWQTIVRDTGQHSTEARTVSSAEFTAMSQQLPQMAGAMAGNMGASFGAVAASAMSNFSSMQSEASSRTSAMNSMVSANASSMQSAVTGSIVGMRANSAAQMALLAASASTQTSNMQSTASSNASRMASQVGSHTLGMRTAAALQMGLMASSAKTSGSQMNTGLTGWMSGALARIAATMASMVSTVRNAAGGGYDAGYYAGSMISQGFANGMSAYLGQIRAAGNAMVAEASRAVIARAMISSPSRLFEGYGKYIGEGLEIGILKSIPDIGRAADHMLDTGMPSPAFNTPIGHGGGGSSHQTVYIDRSQYFTVTTEEMSQIKRQAKRGDAAYGHLSDPDAHNYGGGI